MKWDVLSMLHSDVRMEDVLMKNLNNVHSRQRVHHTFHLNAIMVFVSNHQPSVLHSMIKKMLFIAKTSSLKILTFMFHVVMEDVSLIRMNADLSMIALHHK
jgi:hypothetical protein